MAGVAGVAGVDVGDESGVPAVGAEGTAVDVTGAAAARPGGTGARPVIAIAATTPAAIAVAAIPIHTPIRRRSGAGGRLGEVAPAAELSVVGCGEVSSTGAS